MSRDVWPAIKVQRFDDEPYDQYQLRRDEIVEIINGFRRGYYAGDEAELFERRLIALQEGYADLRQRVAA